MADLAPPGHSILVDAFAGVGGNTIAFAKSGEWKRVYAVEKDPIVLQCARHNAKVYGVENKITWFEGDCFDILRRQLKDLGPYSVLFASPPWGGRFQLFCPLVRRIYWLTFGFKKKKKKKGPAYRSDHIFDLHTMVPYSLHKLYSEFSAFSEHMVLYLPRTSDLRQLAKGVKDGHRALAMHYCMEGASKALCIFYGGFRINGIIE